MTLPEDGKRYEIIDGELFVSKQPSWHHQYTCVQLAVAINRWDPECKFGRVNFAPGLIFAEDDDVAPDLVWISHGRLSSALGSDGKLHQPPELVVEVVSPGPANERRDREAKLNLYSRRGVDEYWIADLRGRSIDIYHRVDDHLQLVRTLANSDQLETDLLPGFSCSIDTLFETLPS
jgi:Uma2 family endonuclease